MCVFFKGYQLIGDIVIYSWLTPKNMFGQKSYIQSDHKAFTCLRDITEYGYTIKSGLKEDIDNTIIYIYIYTYVDMQVI